MGEDVNSMVLLNLLSGTEYSVQVTASYPTGQSEPQLVNTKTREHPCHAPPFTLCCKSRYQMDVYDISIAEFNNNSLFSSVDIVGPKKNIVHEWRSLCDSWFVQVKG